MWRTYDMANKAFEYFMKLQYTQVITAANPLDLLLNYFSETADVKVDRYVIVY